MGAYPDLSIRRRTMSRLPILARRRAVLQSKLCTLADNDGSRQQIEHFRFIGIQ